MPREGVFARVVKGGTIRTGDEMKLLPTPADLPLRAAVITLSDKGSRGEREDKSGPLIVEMLTATGYKVEEALLLPDDAAQLKTQLLRLADARQVNLILTTGGTGFAPRDITPEVTLSVAERNAPGIAEAMRYHSLTITPRGMLSRAASVLRGKTLIVNLPGSPKAVKENLEYILPSLAHGIRLAAGLDESEMCPDKKVSRWAAPHPVPYQMQRFILKAGALIMNNTKISRRSFLAAAGIAGAAAALTACGSSASSTASSVAGSAAASSEAAGGSVELIVFAAASLTETLTAIGEIYSAENPGVTFSFNFDSSGTLKTQIQEGADCDLFISAGQKQMNQLDSTASADVNTEGLDFVDSDFRVDLLENKVVLCVPENGDKGIDSFDSLAEHLKAGDILFCMGNSDARGPVQKILAYYALDEEALAAAGVITYGSNVKEVTTQITEASVDAGVVYCTDAYSAGLTPVDEATKEMCGQVIYPAAVLKAAPNAEAAREFLAYLQTDRAATVFERVGFTAL